MFISRSIALAALAALAVPSGVLAQEESPWNTHERGSFDPTTARATDGWRYRADLIFTMPLQGYEPATVLSHDQASTYDAARSPRRLFRTGAILLLDGTLLGLDARPYVDVRPGGDGRGARVRMAGIEARLAIAMPFSSAFVIGLYHHSAHNFADGAYGFGTNLNSVFADIRLLANVMPFVGGMAAYQLRFESHIFLTRDASPFLLTQDALVLPHAAGQTWWRAGVRLEARNAHARTDLNVVINGDDTGELASVVFDLPLTFRVGPALLGTLGERLYLGPYMTVGANARRADDFGLLLWSIGLRADIVIASEPQ